MQNMHSLPRPMPGSSNTFAKVLGDLSPDLITPPVVKITSPEESTKRRGDLHSHSTHHDDKVVHGLHHCYRVEHGHVVPDHHCRHDHHRLSQGHLDEMVQSAANHLAHTHLTTPGGGTRRRRSITNTTSCLPAEEEEFRPRSKSDASMKRRQSMPAEFDGGRSQGSGSRRGSNVAPEDLHYVYEQYLKGKH